jgi:hypothetical protein
MTEKQFMAQIVSLAKLYGWKVYHTFDSRRSTAGYPDLTLVRGYRLIFAEVKTDTGKVTDEQWGWINALDLTGATAELWRPMNWEHIQEMLTR